MNKPIKTIKKYQLAHLDCANCAATIEEGVKKLPAVRFASVNFATATIHLDTDDLELVKEAIKKIDPQVEIKSEAEPSNISDGQLKRDHFKIGAALLLFIFGFTLSYWLETADFVWIGWGAFGFAYFLSGGSVILKAVENIRKGNWFDETFLMSVSTVGAILIGEIPEAVGVMVFYQIGELVQQRSVERSRNTIQSLLNVRPDTATVIREGMQFDMRPEDVAVGETLLVRPGEKVPLDGILISGDSSLDTSALTGESLPKAVSSGMEVFAGSINQGSVLTVQVSQPYEQSSVARMLDLVQNAASRKARTERFITRFAKVYSPAMVVIALLVAMLPPLLLPGEAFGKWIYRALVVLVVSCPCALVISIPLGYFGGVGGASRRGILVKGANFLDVLADVETVVFDKTGTLTKGVFKVTEIVPEEGYSKDELLALAAQAESHSNHPVAHSIRRAYGASSVIEGLTAYDEVPGHGVRLQANGRSLLAGNDAMLHLNGIAHERCDLLGTVVHVAVDNLYAGYIVIADEIKPDAAGSIQAIRRAGVKRVMMLSGDQDEAARSVAEQLGLDGFRSSLLPEEKVAALDEILTEGESGKVAFVGDGINDAPALARADVGIAMGALGSDAAIETADVVLMNDSLAKVGEAIHLGRKTRKIVWQNIGLALGIKAVFIVLGVFGVATMWEAVFADVGVAVLAVLNATRVLR